jgi:hypothetical protein
VGPYREGVLPGVSLQGGRTARWVPTGRDVLPGGSLQGGRTARWVPTGRAQLSYFTVYQCHDVPSSHHTVWYLHVQTVVTHLALSSPSI